jgi:hypothetical protein
VAARRGGPGVGGGRRDGEVGGGGSRRDAAGGTRRPGDGPDLAACRRRHPAGKGHSGVTPPPYVADMDEHTSSAVVPPMGAQQPLPFDDEADHPIPFRLTARARRTVAPDRLPPLEVVPDRGTGDRGHRTAPGTDAGEDDGHLDDPTDTRPARARALRRAGIPVARIATQLGVDELAVRAWTGDVTVTETDEAVRALPTGAQARDLEVEHDRLAFELARAAAREDAVDRLARDADFAAGVGLAAALAEVDVHAVTLSSGHPEVVGRLLTWLSAHADVDLARVRVVLRLGPDVAGDVARHRWAAGLALPVERISHTRWRGAPAPDATDALVRLHDPSLAATVAGWRDALLAPPTGDDPAGVAF